MANYFTRFSCLLDVGTSQNAAGALTLYNAMFFEEGEPPFDGFHLSIYPEAGGTKLWMHDHDYAPGNPDSVIQFVKRCATEFDLTGLWGFQYAETCSMPRFDAFGGGAQVIDLATGQTIDQIYTNMWLSILLDGGDPYA